MNNPLNKSTEAGKLEESYMTRLRAALLSVPEQESRQIVEDVREHIRATLTERHGASEIGLSWMAAVLEELGPPEDVAQDPVEEYAQPKQAIPPVSPVPPVATSDSVPACDNGRIGDRLDQLFFAFTVSILGLYVPFIDFHFCAIIGSAILVYFLGRMAMEPGLKELRSARPFAIGILLSYVLLFFLGLLSLAGKGADLVSGLLVLPLIAVQIICDLSAYWIIMGVLGGVASSRGAEQLAEQVKRRRITYLILYLVIIMFALVIGVVLGLARVNRVVLELVPFFLLPLSWILGWIFVLSPIRAVRRIMR